MRSSAMLLAGLALLGACGSDSDDNKVVVVMTPVFVGSVAQTNGVTSAVLFVGTDGFVPIQNGVVIAANDAAAAAAASVGNYYFPAGCATATASGNVVSYTLDNCNGPLGVTVWHPLETTIALTHLIFEGTLDRFPGLKICAAHGGGYLPSYMNRSDRGCQVFPEQCQPGVPKKHPTEYVKRMYYDSLVFTPEGLRHLVAEVGAQHVLMGTDYPFPWVSDPVGHILKTPGLSDADREAMLGGTAAKLFGLGAPALR